MKDTDKPYSIKEIREHIYRLRTKQSRVALERIESARLASTLQQLIDNLDMNKIADDRSAKYWAIFQEVLSFELGFPDHTLNQPEAILDSCRGLLDRVREVCRQDVDTIWPNRAEAEKLFIESYAVSRKKYSKKLFWRKLFSR